jgi:hypothetical protein
MSASAKAAVGLAFCCLAAGCATSATSTVTTVDRAAVAKRFARAIFRGDTRTAVGLVESRQGLSGSVRLAALPWKRHHGRVRLLVREPGGHFVLGFSGMHPHPDGRFELVHGRLVVVVGPRAVEAFTFRDVVTTFKTHHDSQLLPSAR